MYQYIFRGSFKVKVEIQITNLDHVMYAEEICRQIEMSALARGTGIAKREVSYIKTKIELGRAIIALAEDASFAGFCYIETWGHEKFVANSGLIVVPYYRNLGLANEIKIKAFQLSRTLFPEAKLFGLTTNQSVMNINSALGYRPVTYSQLTDDEFFWKGCQSCVNFQTLQSKSMKNCLCTAMVFDPQYQRKISAINIASFNY
ncbi:hypothetical protein MEO40_12390 [Dolichospermum sp. ST_sed1]|nr:hypothetical protein [Dolichospermum sp. ST_sed1]